MTEKIQTADRKLAEEFLNRCLESTGPVTAVIQKIDDNYHVELSVPKHPATMSNPRIA